MSLRYPLIAPNPPRLSEHLDDLRRVEASGVFSNGGPELRAFEAEANEQLFDGHGATLAVANATLGLMVAIRHAIGGRPAPDRYAVVPAMTFAATAQAAEWAGLTPLVTDIDPETWATCPQAEERLLRTHGERIAALVPYAAFGSVLDLDRYAWLQRRFGVGVVIDAAGSLGTRDEAGCAFGADAPFAVVHSMHATKSFAIGEGGLIHSGDGGLVDALRRMVAFGFDGGRSAVGPGTNAKLPEIAAIMARAKLAGFGEVCATRSAVEEAYRAALGGFQLQQVAGARRALQFLPVLLPDALASRRDAITAALAERGIGVGRYFSPHLGEQPWFRDHALVEPTPVADTVAARMLSLPVTDTMTPADAVHIARALEEVCAAQAATRPARAAGPRVFETVLVGGGPAGTAMLTAAAKAGRLPDLAAGLALVEQSERIGDGRLGRYAITSDSTAQTFLTAVENNPEPGIAALADHPAARAVGRYRDALGVPLVEVGPLLGVTGDRLAAVIRDAGGAVLTGYEALDTKASADGLWRTRVRAGDGTTRELLSRHVVIATGGHQPLGRLAHQQVAGAPLVELAGERLVQSDQVLALGGFEMIADLLAGKRDPRIVVIGGSTSALTTVALLLRRTPALPLGAGGITLLHRRPLRPFYPSREAALADGFTDWGEDDVCPVSGFVYRLAGFRLEARELVLRLLSVGGRRPDPRVVPHRIAGEDDAAARRIVAEADLVIAAFGYRPHALPVLGADDRPISLRAELGGPMVDRHCRVVDADGAPLPGLYGIGLAAGFVPWGPLGGEASFTGQANGLWLWQNDVGRMIVDQLLEAGAAGAARAAA